VKINPVWTQEDYAFYSDGTESGATIVGSAGAQQTLDTDTVYHCRLLIADTVGANVTDPLTLLWQYNLAGGGWATITGSTPIQFVDNANLTDGGATTNRQPTGTGTFNAGRIYESANTSATVFTLPGDETTQHTEAVLHFQIDSAQVTHGQELLIRCVLGDSTVFGGTYVNADIDINEPVGATAVTLVADSFTLTDGTLTIRAEQETRITLGADSFTLTDGTLSITQVSGTDVTLGADSFTLTPGTLTIRAENETRISLVPDSFTLTPGTLGIEAETQFDLIADAFTLSEGALSIVQAAPVTVTLGADAFTITPGTLGITQSNPVAVTLVADAFTVTPGTLTVTAENETRITLVPDGFTLTGGVLTVTGTAVAEDAAAYVGGWFGEAAAAQRRKQAARSKQAEAEAEKAAQIPLVVQTGVSVALGTAYEGLDYAALQDEQKRLEAEAGRASDTDILLAIHLNLSVVVDRQAQIEEQDMVYVITMLAA